MDPNLGRREVRGDLAPEEQPSVLERLRDPRLRTLRVPRAYQRAAGDPLKAGPAV